MAGGEGVIAQVAHGHGRSEPLGQCLALLHGVSHHHTATGENHRKLCGGQKLRGLPQAVLTARAALHTHGLGNLALNFAIEIIARDVQLRGTHFRDGTIETACGVLGHTLGVVHVALVLGELLEHRELIGLLEAAQAHAHGARLGRHNHHWTVGPVRGRDRGHAVADAWPVLTNHHAMPPRNTRKSIGHVGRALLMHHRNQANACGCKDVHGVHEGRPHDSKNFGHAVGDHCFDKRLGRRHFLHARHGLTKFYKLVHTTSFGCGLTDPGRPVPPGEWNKV